MNRENVIRHTDFATYDPEVVQYARWTGGHTNIMEVWEYNGWQAETRSWKEGVYISSHLSGSTTDLCIQGPDAEKFMSEYFINNSSIEKFPVGKGKHYISCSPKGTITAHGVGMRLAEDCFSLAGFAMLSVAEAAKKAQGYDIEIVGGKYYRGLILQVCGPDSLSLMQEVIDEDLHDLKFMNFRDASVNGTGVRVLRMGMGGTLAYEIHATAEDAQKVYDYVVELGKKYHAERLGLLSYMCNHTLNGFPQWSQHFMLASHDDPEIREYYEYYDRIELHGSLSDLGQEAYYRNPFELGWGKMISWDHEFRGKEALLKMKDDPATRRICNLEWNVDDIMKIHRAMYDQEDMRLPDIMNYPQNYYFGADGQLGDKVLNAEGKMIGKSSGVLYDCYYKTTISQCVIDPKYSELGTEVTILWGTSGTRQIPIRAKVVRYPYLDLPANRDYDIASIPAYEKKK